MESETPDQRYEFATEQALDLGLSTVFADEMQLLFLSIAYGNHDPAAFLELLK